MPQDKRYRILTINPGSTFTAFGIFDNEKAIFENTILHEEKLFNSCPNIIDQFEFRKKSILEIMDNEGLNVSKLSAVCGRGGSLRPIAGGTYTVNQEMLADMQSGFAGHHASNLGGVIAFLIAKGLNIPAFISNPVVVDEREMQALAEGALRVLRGEEKVKVYPGNDNNTKI